MDISNFKGVIFDLDGTLIESGDVWTQIDIDFLGKRGFAVPENYGKAVSAMDFRQAAVYTKELFSLPETIEEIAAEWRDMAIWHYTHDIDPVKGAPEFVRKLHSKGVKLALATASSRELYEPVLKRCGMYEYFSEFVTTSQVERGKGFPDIYLLAAKLLGEKPEDCAVFEDIPEGVNAAKTGGFTVFARLNPHYTPDREKMICAAHKSFESFTELWPDLNT
jgi:HAD superfamily hydrolase (TIGR01509 family)